MYADHLMHRCCPRPAPQRTVLSLHIEPCEVSLGCVRAVPIVVEVAWYQSARVRTGPCMHDGCAQVLQRACIPQTLHVSMPDPNHSRPPSMWP